MQVRLDINFTGHVQGVGFRYTAVAIAQPHPVTGWVRNESDGSVRCVVEGEQLDVDRYLASLQEAMAGYITDTRVQKLPATSEFTDFRVLY